jgi:hypothetical protein
MSGGGQYSFQRQPFQGQSQAYTGAQGNAMRRMQMMPQFNSAPPNSYGGMGGGWRSGPQQPGGRDYLDPGPGYGQVPQTSGMHPFQPQMPTFQAPQATGGGSPMEGQMNPGMNKPMLLPQSSDQAPTGGVTPQDGFNSPQAMLKNTASVAGFQNPMGFTRQQLGPSFNPQGSPQGGYFNGNQYVPNVGNFRNGLDELARWGQNWNGAPLNGGGLFIR